MKEAIVSKGETGPVVKIVDSPIPEPADDQVLIKVAVSGSNPKDWKLAYMFGLTLNAGDDIAGTVAKVGKDVFEFKPGDRVAAFHQMMTPGGSFAEYAVAPQHTTFHIPSATTFEEASTIPLAAATAVMALYKELGLPQPWTPAATTPSTTGTVGPLVIYGAGSAVGAFAIQLARKSNIHPLIVVAGRSASFVEGLIDRGKGDVIVDYRGGADAVAKGIEDAAGGAPLRYGFDAVSTQGSGDVLIRVLADGAKLTTVTKLDGQALPRGLRWSHTMVGAAHTGTEENGGGRDLGYVGFRFFGRGLAEGWLKPHPHKVVPGGLGGIQGALEDLYHLKASAVKYVFRVPDTEGAGQSRL